LRVLWLTGEYPPDVGGIATVAQQTLRALAARSISTHALVCARGEADGSDGPTTLTRRPIAESIIETDAAGIARWVAFLRRFKAETAADVYHLHPADPSVVTHLMTLSSHPAPTVLTFHQQMFTVLPGAEPDSLMGRLIAEAKVITTVSAASADEAVEHLPAIADRVIVIPNGLEVGEQPKPIPGAPEIVAVGRLVPLKGFHDLIAAMPKVLARLPRAHLTIVGDGAEAGALRRLSDGLGLADAVSFAGAASQEEVRAFMDASTIVAMPSAVEGMPMVALEAAERGRAVIASEIGGVKEIVIDTVTGVLVSRDEDFVDSFATALADLLEDPDRAAQLGRAARARMESRHSVEQAALLYDTVYRAVSTSSPAPPVSVIMPAWNGALHIREAVESVLGQTVSDLELIVVDDGSADATLEVLRAVSDPRLIVVPQPKRGAGSARNAGIALSRGRYIAHIDHDDTWPHDRLERLLQVLETSPDVDACFGSSVEFADPGMQGSYVVRSEPTVTRFPTTGLIRADAHRRVGPFHRAHFGDQVDWAMRAVDLQLRSAECDGIVLRRRIHDSNMSHGNPLAKDLSKLRLLKRSLDQRRARSADEA